MPDLNTDTSPQPEQYGSGAARQNHRHRPRVRDPGAVAGAPPRPASVTATESAGIPVGLGFRPHSRLTPRTCNLHPLMLTNTEEIENDVRAALDRDPRITHPELIASSVDAISTVDLRGAVDSLPQHRAAARDARQIEGVFEVIVDDLKVHPPVTHHRADDEIRALALQRLGRDTRIHAEHIHVEVSQGRVTLSGYVRAQSQSAACGRGRSRPGLSDRRQQRDHHSLARASHD